QLRAQLPVACAQLRVLDLERGHLGAQLHQPLQPRAPVELVRQPPERHRERERDRDPPEPGPHARGSDPHPATLRAPVGGSKKPPIRRVVRSIVAAPACDAEYACAPPCARSPTASRTRSPRPSTTRRSS